MKVGGKGPSVGAIGRTVGKNGGTEFAGGECLTLWKLFVVGSKFILGKFLLFGEFLEFCLGAETGTRFCAANGGKIAGFSCS